MATVTPAEMKSAYADVARVKARVDALFDKMAAAVPESHKHPERTRFDRYSAACQEVDQASTHLLAALDWLRYTEE